MSARPWLPDKQSVVLLGEFDGFHLGHRQLVHRAGLVATRLGRALVAVVLVDQSVDLVLTSVEERCWALLASGASSVHAMSITSPDHPDTGSQLVDEVIARLAPAAVVMACLPGDESSARYPSLRLEFSRRATELIEVPRWSDPDGQYVTSSRLKMALRQGEIVAANDWLGRPFTLTGVVVHGSGLGRTIGFPTANLDLPQDRLVPMNGVYAGVVGLPNGEQHRAAINIGVRPTVETDGTVLVEAHLLDFDDDLYGATIDVGFRRWLRHEQRFESLDALVAQLATDVAQTRLLLRATAGPW
jgi:riboflavin kinase / FMN adenylyltransferase